MEHHFDIDNAIQYGLDEAIILNHLIFWIEKNRANKRNFINGYHWTYSSYKAFTEIFPYWKELKIKRILDSLVKQEVILRENHNKAGYDRTCWYALKNEESIFQKRNIHISKMKNGDFKNERPIPYNLTYNNTYNNTDKELTFFSSDYKNLWLEWVEYKKTEFKDNFKTKKAEQTAINQLQKISNNDIEIAKEIVNLSIANRWKGLFKLKTTIKTTNNGKTTSDYYRENYERNLKWATEWDIAEGRQPIFGSEENG
jgi:hypothetical protein